MTARSSLGVVVLVSLIAIAIFFSWPRRDERSRASSVSSSSSRAAHARTRHVRTASSAAGVAGDEASAEEEQAETEGVAANPRWPVRVHGIVVRDGSGAPHARVHATSEDDGDLPTVITDSEGRFSIDLPRGETIVLEARAAPQLRGVRVFSTLDEPDEEVRIELRASWPVRVVVKAQDGAPVAGAKVSMDAPPEGLGGPVIDHERLVATIAEWHVGPVTTLIDGTARLPLTHAGRYAIEAEHAELGVASTKRELAESDANETIELVLAGGSAVSGRVIDEADGAPIAGARLVLSPLERDGSLGLRRSTSDVDGRFRIGGVPALSFALGVEADGWLERELKLEKKDATNDLSVEVVLSRGAGIAGRVLTEKGEPLVGWRIFAVDAELARIGDPLRVRATSGADGAFEVRGLEEGEYRLTALGPNESAVRQGIGRLEEGVVAKTGDRGVVLHPARVVTLRGEVRFEGAPAPDHFDVMLGGLERKTFSGATFEVELRARTQLVIVGAPGFSDQRQVVRAGPDDVATAVFTLQAARTLRGRVLERGTDLPVAGASVRVVDDFVGALAAPTGGTAITDAEGRFTLDRVPARAVSLLVTPSKHSTELAGPFDPDRTEPVVIYVAKTVEVSGRVHRGREPLNGVGVYAMPAGAEENEAFVRSRHAYSERGLFSIAGVAPGKVTLVASILSDDAQSFLYTWVDVPAGGLRDVDLAFPAGGARVVIALPPRAGEELEVKLLSVPSGPPRAIHEERSVLDDRLELTFENVPYGTYDLHLQRLPSGRVTNVPAVRESTQRIVVDAPEVRATLH